MNSLTNYSKVTSISLTLNNDNLKWRAVHLFLEVSVQYKDQHQY